MKNTCGKIVNFERRYLGFKSLISMPSILIWPCIQLTRRVMAINKDDLPDPDLPTIPTYKHKKEML